MYAGVGDGGPSVRARRRPTAAVSILLVLFPTGTTAMGILQHPSVERSAACVRGILCDASSPGRRRSLSVELSDFTLYGVSDLRVSGVRVGGRAGWLSLVAEAAQLQADLGGETRLALTPCVQQRGRWAASLGLVYERVDVDGARPASLASATARSLVNLSREVAVGGEVVGYRLYGEECGGVDLSMAVLVRPVDGTTIRAVLGVGRWSGVQPSLSATVGPGRRFRLTVGYEAATDALKCAFAVEVRGFTCAAGFDYHPVLGRRQGVSLTWGR